MTVCKGCGYVKAKLCGAHAMCDGCCDGNCYGRHEPKQRKEKCPRCKAPILLKREGETKCRKCKLRIIRWTRVVDGWKTDRVNRRSVTKSGVLNYKEGADFAIDPDGVELEIVTESSKVAMYCRWSLDRKDVWYLVPREQLMEHQKESTMTARKGRKTGGAIRQSALAGQYVFKTAKENPYRDGTNLHKVYAKIRDGMTVEAFKDMAKKSIIFYSFLRQCTIVVTATKTKPTGTALSRLKTAQSRGVGGESERDLRKSTAAAPATTKKTTKKKAAKKSTRKKAAKKSTRKRTTKKKEAMK